MCLVNLSAGAGESPNRQNWSEFLSEILKVGWIKTLKPWYHVARRFPIAFTNCVSSDQLVPFIKIKAPCFPFTTVKFNTISMFRVTLVEICCELFYCSNLNNMTAKQKWHCRDQESLKMLKCLQCMYKTWFLGITCSIRLTPANRCVADKSEVKEPVTCLNVFLTDRMMASLVHLTLHWQQCNWGNSSLLSPTCPILCSGPSILAFYEILTTVSCTHEGRKGWSSTPLLCPGPPLPHGWLKVSASPCQLAYNTKYPIPFLWLVHLWITCSYQQ